MTDRDDGGSLRTDAALPDERDGGHTSASINHVNTADAARAGDDTVPLRRNRDFLLLWTGQAVSGVGSNMAAIVYPLLALAATGSAAQAGAVGFVGLLVGVLLRLPAGVLADRYPLKPILVVADLVRAGVTGSIIVAIVAGRVTLPQLLVAAALSAGFGTAFESAQAVAVRRVVPSGQLPRALAQNEARGHLASLAGQPIGGYLYGVGAAFPVLADALSYVVSATLISLIRAPLNTRRGGGVRTPIWRDIPVGLRYVWDSAFLRVTLLCAAGINLVFGGLSLVIIAAQVANGTDAVHVGVVFSMGAVGGILGAWAAGRVQGWLSPAGLIYCFGWTASVALVGLSWVHNTYLVGGLLALMFCTATPANAMLFAVQIHVTPPELQGRVISASMLVGGIVAPLGPLLGGFLFEHSGQALTFLAFAAVVATITVGMQFSTAIRTMARPG